MRLRPGPFTKLDDVYTIRTVDAGGQPVELVAYGVVDSFWKGVDSVEPRLSEVRSGPGPGHFFRT